VEKGRVDWWGGQGKKRWGREMMSCDGDCLGPAVACWTGLVGKTSIQFYPVLPWVIG